MSNATEIDRGAVLAFDHVSKHFKKTVALENVTLDIARGSIVGLVGRNGCGKTTLLHHATGLLLPTTGVCRTFGVPTDQLGASALTRIGAVQQHAKLLGWMRVGQLVRYVGTFYDRWDATFAATLTERLQLAPDAAVSSLSPGNVQKLSLVLALAHHPELLLLDEPLSDLDPTARKEVVAILLEYFAADERTIVISSHLLHDIEPMVNRIVCLEQGRITTNAELDTLKEEYEEWIVSARGATLPTSWSDPIVARSSGNASEARLIVRGSPDARRAQMAMVMSRYSADVQTRSLNLEELFPLLTRGNDRHANTDHGGGDRADGKHARR